MEVNNRMRVAMRILALGVLALSLSACQSVRNAVGLVKSPPDEFAIATKAPLIIPPDFNLHPPRPGAAPTNQISPTAAAQAALFGASKEQIASSIPGNFSEGERLLLANAGAAYADPSIRQKIAADNKSLESADDSLTNTLLFGALDSPNTGTPVNANAEKQRIDNAKINGKSGKSANTPKSDASGDATIQKDSGWFDGIF